MSFDECIQLSLDDQIELAEHLERLDRLRTCSYVRLSHCRTNENQSESFAHESCGSR